MRTDSKKRAARKSVSNKRKDDFDPAEYRRAKRRFERKYEIDLSKIGLLKQCS